MKYLLYIGIDHTKIVVALLSIITAVSLYQLPNLRLEITAEGMMVKSDPARLFYEQTLDTFGSDNVTIVYLQDPHLFKPENLNAIHDVVKELEASPLVDHTDSLFSIRHLRTVDGFTYTNPYLKNIPQDYQHALLIRDAALKNPLVKNNLLSVDGQAMAINVYYDPTKYYRGFDEAVANKLNQLLEPLKSSLDRVFFIGDPYIRSGISERIRADQQLILPGAIILLIITLSVSLRNIQAALIPLMTAGISVIWILGLMAYLTIPVNVMNSVIPALLIIIGSTEDIHLLAEYLSGLQQGKSRQQALGFMASNMGTAVMLTFVTTYVGFLSISLNDLSLLQQFGLLTSSGLLFNFIVTLLLVPACLSVFGKIKVEAQATTDNNVFQFITRRLFEITEKHRFRVIFLLVSTALLGIYSAMDLRINNNVMDYFSSNSDFAKNSQILHRDISGIQTFSIVLSGEVGTFQQVPYIEELWSIQEYLKETRLFDKSFSFADFIAVVHSGIDGERPGEVYLPTQNEVVSGYMTFLDHQVARALVSPDYSQAKIIIRHNISDSAALNQAVADIYRFTEIWLDPVLNVQVTGESYLNSRAVDYMAKGQAQSLLLMLAVIFVLMSILFLNTKAGWIALTTNLFPIIILFGVMGFLDIPLNTGTAMVAAISLGICVDHSMHFMVRYNRLSKSANSMYEALATTIREESMPIFATALALAVGFGALTISDFPPVARFGQLSALVMLLALISTFVITPLFLRYVRLFTVWDMLSVDLKEDVIKRSPLFFGIRNWQARKIVAMSEIREYNQGEVILTQAGSVEHLYMPLEGHIEAWRTDKDGSAHLIGTLYPGEVFGVVTPQEDQNSSADMVAVVPARLLKLKSKDIQNIEGLNPRLAARLFKNLCEIGDFLNTEEEKSPQLYDDHSGVFSATIFIELLRYIIDRTNRYDEPLTILIIKLVPSSSEHKLEGESKHHILRRIVLDIIQPQLRRVDRFGLWDDGSYWVSMPQTNITAAKVIEKRMMKSLAKNQNVNGNGLEVKFISSEYNADETLESFVKRLSSGQ